MESSCLKEHYGTLSLITCSKQPSVCLPVCLSALEAAQPGEEGTLERQSLDSGGARPGFQRCFIPACRTTET